MQRTEVVICDIIQPIEFVFIESKKVPVETDEFSDYVLQHQDSLRFDDVKQILPGTVLYVRYKGKWTRGKVLKISEVIDGVKEADVYLLDEGKGHCTDELENDFRKAPNESRKIPARAKRLVIRNVCPKDVKIDIPSLTKKELTAPEWNAKSIEAIRKLVSSASKIEVEASSSVFNKDEFVYDGDLFIYLSEHYMQQLKVTEKELPCSLKSILLKRFAIEEKKSPTLVTMALPQSQGLGRGNLLKILSHRQKVANSVNGSLNHGESSSAPLKFNEIKSLPTDVTSSERHEVVPHARAIEGVEINDEIQEHLNNRKSLKKSAMLQNFAHSSKKRLDLPEKSETMQAKAKIPTDYDTEDVIIHRDPESIRCKPIKHMEGLDRHKRLRPEYSQRLEKLNFQHPRHNIQKGKKIMFKL